MNKAEFIKQLDRYLEENKEKMISDIAKIVNINTELRDSDGDGCPFGKETARALDTMLSISEENGAAVKNGSGYYGTADFFADGTAPSDDFHLGIMTHLDVVPAGDGWHSDPYEMIIKDNVLYGRGVTDDKGPAVSSLYAVKAVREILGLKKNVRLIFGCGEEIGSDDMERFFAENKSPEWIFSPDAEFPLINVEKGRYAGIFEKTISGKAKDCNKLDIISFEGGKTQNIVPGKASAKIYYNTDDASGKIQQAIKNAEKYTGCSFSLKETDTNTFYILCEGVSSHASLPELGNNAQTALLCLISFIHNDYAAEHCTSCENCHECAEPTFFDVAKQLLRLMPHKETDGTHLGVAGETKTGGKLTLNFGVLSYDGQKITFGIDIRHPFDNFEDALAMQETIGKSFFALDFHTASENLSPLHYSDENSVLVKTLLSAYNDTLGVSEKCIAIGGGTYVHNVERGVAFGPEFPGHDARIHSFDENMPIEDLLLATKIYSISIADLCGKYDENA